MNWTGWREVLHGIDNGSPWKLWGDELRIERGHLVIPHEIGTEAEMETSRRFIAERERLRREATRKETPSLTNIRFKVETEVDGATLRQTTTSNASGFDETTKRVLDTEDAQVRAALIQMGWTPPP